MRASTNISLRERRQLRLENFRGVDLSSHETNVAPSRASYMRNFIMRDGLNSKRHGWREVLKFVDEDGKPQRINGIFPYVHSNATFNKLVIVNSEDGFYRIKLNNYAEIDFCEKIVPSSSTHNIAIKHGKGQAFYQNDKMYIVGNGCFLIYENDYYNDEIFGSVIDSSDDNDVYIPTTTVSINHEGAASKDDVIKSVEPANMLTSYRYNMLVGIDELSGEWRLDDAITQSTTVTVVADVSNCVCSESGKTVVPHITLKNDKNNVLKVTEATDLLSGDSLMSEDGKIRINDFFSDGHDEGNAGTIILDGTIKLFFKTNPVSDDGSNILVKFSSAGMMARLNSKNFFICSAKNGVVFGVGGREDTLFLSDGSNRIYYSEAGEFNYFPDTNFITVGESLRAGVTGFTVASDNTLIVFKEKSMGDAGIYYVNGSYYEKNMFDKEGKEVVIQIPQYTVTRGEITESLINPFCCVNLCGENLFLSERGVYGIALAENLSIVQRNTFERSEPIRSALQEQDLSDACAIAYGDKYYLAIDGACYVADAKYKYSAGDSRAGAYNYEWWVWDNIPARVFAEVNGELWFGTEDGRICKFDGEFSDRPLEHADTGLLTFDEYENETRVTYSKSLNEKIYNGQRVLFELKDSDGKSLSAKAYVDVDKAEQRIDGRYIYVSDKDESESTFKLRYYNDFESPFIKLSFPDGAPSEITAILEQKRNVIAEWHTPALDLGTNIYSKSLEQITVSARAVSRGSLDFGYETRRNLFSAAVKGINKFSFEDFSFEDFTFDTGFPVSYTRRVKERNFNYIKFKFRSDGDRDCGINNLTAVYKINKANKGVK